MTKVAKIIDKKLLVKDRIAQEFGQAYNLFLLYTTGMMLGGLRGFSISLFY